MLSVPPKLVELPRTGKKGVVPKGSPKNKSRHLIDGPGILSNGEEGAAELPVPNGVTPEPPEGGPDVELPSTGKKGGVSKGSPKRPAL
jgi:hypothetical protein